MMTALLVQRSSDGGPLPDLLKQAGYGQVVSACSGARARQLVARQTFDLILCNAPLQDETGEPFCCDCAARTDAGVVLIVGRERAGEVGAVSYTHLSIQLGVKKVTEFIVSLRTNTRNK